MNINLNNKTMTIEKLALKGTHNIFNSMAAAMAARVFEVSDDKIRKSLIDFENVEHRLEYVLKVHGIDFINDSKATNYHAVSEGTKLFSACDEEGILILHGITKETVQNKLNIDPTFKHIVIPKDMNVNLGSHNADIIYIDDIYQLKKLLPSMISSNQIILFSCGGSSFNDFENYKIRGDYFKNLILSMGLPND